MCRRPKPKENLSLIAKHTDGALEFVEIRPTFGQETSELIWTTTALQEAHQLRKQIKRFFKVMLLETIRNNDF